MTTNPTPTSTKITRYNNSFYDVRAFRSNYMSQRLTWQLIDGLYDRTILKKIIQKYCFSIVPSFFNVQIEDKNGKRVTKLEEKIKPLSAVINRTLLQEVIKSFFLYGTAIIYKGDVTNGVPNDLFLLHPRDLDVAYNNEGEFIGFNYAYRNTIVLIPLSDVAILANDPGINEVFGNSILNHTVDTLNEFLNNKLGLSEILDRYAIPLVQWTVDVSEAGVLSEDDIINKTRESLLRDLEQGDDIVSDKRVEAKILEFSNVSTNLIGILQEARKDIGMLTIPESLMGGSISNLSGGKVQQAVFYEEIKGYQAILNDFIVENFYKPFLESDKNSFNNIYIMFPPATSELPSDSIIWIKQAIEMGLINFDEARAILGFRGKAPLVTKELKNYFITKTLKAEVDSSNKRTDDQKIDNQLEPKKRDGRDPDNEDKKDVKNK